MRKSLIILCILAQGGIFYLDPSSANATVRQVHLSWQHDPATTMTIMWATDKNHTPPQVQYGTTTSYGTLAKGSDASHGVVLHTVELTGLKPDTLYHYRVSDDDGIWGNAMTFHTAPTPGQTGQDGIVATVTGDKGPYSDAEAINQQIAKQNADFHIIVGDLAYSSDDNKFHIWIDKQQVYAQSAPIMPAWGNHETTEKDPPYSYSQAHFALPTDATPDERFYSYDVGNTHFVAVDSNADNTTAPGSPQYLWLQKDLAAASVRSPIRWIVVYFHHNIYSAGGKYSNTATPVRDHLQPIFDQYGVDLVLHGHTHYYSRSMPVAYNEIVKETAHTTSYNFSGKNHGQVYVTTGGGGKPLYPCPKRLPAYIIRCDSVYSFGRLTIRESRLTFQAFQSDGTLLDEGITLEKSSPNAEGSSLSEKTKTPQVKSNDDNGTEGESRFMPSDDAMVHEAFPERNYGRDLTLEADRIEEGGQKKIYLKFNITDLPGPITKATLSLKTAHIPFADSDAMGLLYRVSDLSWTEATLTWNNRPPHDVVPLPHRKETAVGRNEIAMFDLSQVITQPGIYAFALVSPSSNGVIYNTKESEVGKPTLVIQWGNKTK